MEKITVDIVKRMASLSRLGIREKEAQDTTAQLTKILNHFAVIQGIDTSGVPTSDDISGLENVTRADKTASDTLCSAATLLELAPATLRDHIKVEAVFAENNEP